MGHLDIAITKLGPGRYDVRLRGAGREGPIDLGHARSDVQQEPDTLEGCGGVDDDLAEDEKSLSSDEEEAPAPRPIVIVLTDRKARRRALRRAIKRAAYASRVSGEDLDPKVKKILKIVEDVTSLFPAAYAGKEAAKAALKAYLNSEDPETRRIARGALDINHGNAK